MIKIINHQIEQGKLTKNLSIGCFFVFVYSVGLQAFHWRSMHDFLFIFVFILSFVFSLAINRL